MLVLPLVAPPKASEEQAQRVRVTLGELKRDEEGELEWGHRQRPVTWRASSPLLVPGSTAMVLHEGDIMFVVVKVVTKQEREKS